MARLGGDEIFVSSHWKPYLRGILTSKDSGEPLAEFLQVLKYQIATEICVFA